MIVLEVEKMVIYFSICLGERGPLWRWGTNLMDAAETRGISFSRPTLSFNTDYAVTSTTQLTQCIASVTKTCLLNSA